VHALALFLSAFLLFLVEPLVGKRLLPWFGGAPAVWTTCLFFFQALLLAGYAFAHGVARLKPRQQVVAYVGLVAATVLQLPIAIGDRFPPTSAANPVFSILEVLLLTIGAPYLLLSATTPLLQRWASRDQRVAAPYSLYAVSNAGALLALLSYPVVWEPRLTLDTQMTAWSITYGAFALLAIALAVSHRRGTEAAPENEGGHPVRGADRLLWVALAACASGLLAATTSEICLDIASVPFLWVLPLGLYLLTFVLAFAGTYHRTTVAVFFAAAAAAACLVTQRGPGMPISWQVAAASLALFFGAWLCHGELVRRRPHASRLTEFYLLLAAGGAGGTLISLAAPLVFAGFWEFPLFLFVTAVLLVAATASSPATPPERWVAGGVMMTAPVLVVALLLWPGPRQAETPVATARNFYGVLHVADDVPPESPQLRRLRNGRILHGVQFLDPARRLQPSSYYGPRSGIDRALRAHPRRVGGQPLRIAVIGLGTGSMAAWGSEGDRMTFYEFNPQVMDFARTYFTYLKDTPATVNVVAGDARLSLNQPRSPDERFDLMVLDAFSGDAIPVHLLTREASDIYWKALREDGILAIHVTNRHLDLTPVVRGMAKAAGKEAMYIANGNNLNAAVFRSNWILLSSSRAVLSGLAGTGQLLDDDNSGPAIVWTDNFSNLFDVLHTPE
jgi:hypothetical protein